MNRQAAVSLVAVVTLVALLCAVSSVYGQAVGRMEFTTKAPFAATESDLARLKVAPQVQLQRLQAEQAAACQPKGKPADCDKKTKQLQAAKPALQNKINWVAKHESDARRGILAAPQKVAPAAKGNNCTGCHSGASASPAQDPITAAHASSPAAQPSGTVTQPPPVHTAQPSIKPGASPSQDPIGPAMTSGTGSSGGTVMPPASAKCFIATAAFGSADADEVMALRRFRDQHLVGTPAGDWFVQAYYRVSPPIANAIADRPVLKSIVRAGLRGVVFAIRSPAAFAALTLAAVVSCFALRRRRHAFRMTAPLPRTTAS
jgi:hypothetical protein